MSWLGVNPTGANPSEGKCRSSSAITGSDQESDVSLTISSCWNGGSCLIMLHGGGLNTTRIKYCIKCQGVRQGSHTVETARQDGDYRTLTSANPSILQEM